jgi:hypothetical protein
VVFGSPLGNFGSKDHANYASWISILWLFGLLSSYLASKSSLEQQTNISRCTLTAPDIDQVHSFAAGPIFDLNTSLKIWKFYNCFSHFTLVRAVLWHWRVTQGRYKIEEREGVHPYALALAPVIETHTRHFILAGFHFSILSLSLARRARGTRELDPIIRIIHLRPVHVLCFSV